MTRRPRDGGASEGGRTSREDLGVPVLCVAVVVERWDFPVAVLDIELARLHQVMAGVELEPGQAQRSSGVLHLLQQPRPDPAATGVARDKHPFHLAETGWQQTKTSK